MPYGIQVRGHRQYRAQVRRNGLYRSETFETLQDAQGGALSMRFAMPSLNRSSQISVGMISVTRAFRGYSS